MRQLEAFVVGDIGTGGWVPMPISGEDFLETAATIGVANPSKGMLFVTEVEPELEALRPHLQQPFDLNELNFFAAKLESLADMSVEAQHAFAASLQARRHCGSVAEMINLMENMNRIDLQPAFTAEEYGAFQINLARDELADIMNQMEDSDIPDEQALVAHVAAMEAHVNLAAYGRSFAENEGGVFTDYGYLTETSPFQEAYRGTQDIPAEFQVSPFPNTELLLRLEHTDLTDVLAKIHNLGGYAGDLERNLETLHRRRSANFLLLLTEDKAVLSEAMHVYREGTVSHDAFVNAADAKMFSIYVTDFQTDFIGDIREVDAAALRADILDHSIHFVDVKAVTVESESITFTPEEWKSISVEERDSFQSWVRQFADGDFTKVNRHIEHQCDADNFWAQPASLDKFFEKLAQETLTEFRASSSRDAMPLLRLEQDTLPHSDPQPDPDVSTSDRNAYGYFYDEMLPLSKSLATTLFAQDTAVYLLYGDDTEALVSGLEDIARHDGLFGIEKADWRTLQNRSNSLAPEPRSKSVLAQITAARAGRAAEPIKPQPPKHRTEPER